MTRLAIKTQLSRARGFTLIELIVVIVILGILAATALPKFIDMRVDARKAIIARTAMEVTGAFRLAFAKCALVNGCIVPSGPGANVPGPDGVGRAMYRGYPTGKTTATLHGIKDWINLSGFTVVELDQNRARFELIGAPDPANCFVFYGDAVASGVLEPRVVTTTTGC